MIIDLNDTIVALSTPQGSGALAIIRLSGDRAINICDQHVNIELEKCDTHTANFTHFHNQNEDIDECVVTIFKAPKSYTTEDIVEISCHGSPYIINKIITVLMSSGARLAQPGEFTQRAYLNGQMDLTQAEAVSDLIASKTAAQHNIALNQMKGGFSKKIKELREELIEFASLIELENDFGEEDVEFADRKKLISRVDEVLDFVQSLLESFQYGNVIKEGLPVAIIGSPNVGKSTLLNALLNEEKAIVSEIPGTTRDVIEDTIQIDGHLYRFIDTAGIRDTTDKIEILGIEKTYEQIQKAKIVLFIAEFSEDFKGMASDFNQISLLPNQKAIILINKVDLYDHTCHSYDVEEAVSTLARRTPTILLSAKTGQGIDQLINLLSSFVTEMKGSNQDIIISNLRHYQSLEKTKVSLLAVKKGLSEDIPSDLVALDLRHALSYLGEISGEISTDDLLESIFSNFCIGK